MRTTFLLALLVLCPAICFAQAPTADIKCNGLDSGVNIDTNTNAKIEFKVVAGLGAGIPVDIWILLNTPFGFFSYDGAGPTVGWWFDLRHAYATGPLANDSGTVLNRGLPAGSYKAHIGIEYPADGRLDLLNLFVHDMVDITVLKAPPPGMAMIPTGAFDMGDHHDSMPYSLPVHTVTLDEFYMDTYEVTNGKYCAYLNTAYAQGRVRVSNDVVYQVGGAGEALCDTTGSSYLSRITWNGSTFRVTAGKANHPMALVSWYGTCTYANQRSRDVALTPCYDETTWDCNFGAGGYRLPTEAEWEYAARGGEHSPYFRFPWGDIVDGSCANYRKSGDPYETGPDPETSPVGYYDGGQIPAGSDMKNGYGLYDVAGNVWEWCHDWYDTAYYSDSPSNNPTGPLSGSCRVVRGGSWYYDSIFTRCASRAYSTYPDFRCSYFGFRLVLD